MGTACSSMTLLGVLRAYSGDYGRLYVRRETLAKLSSMTVDDVDAALVELDSSGAIAIEEPKGDGIVVRVL